LKKAANDEYRHAVLVSASVSSHFRRSATPGLLGGAADREKYLAIGESDRMTLRFVKP
jgi:predicted methyltransferase